MVTEGADEAADQLAERYGRPSRAHRVTVRLVVGLLLGSLTVWWLWATWLHATPQVTSELEGFTIDSEHQATAMLRVETSDDFTTGSCVVTAYAEDHSTVGETVVRLPLDGTGAQPIVIRTERRATAVESKGCTTPDQLRPR